MIGADYPFLDVLWTMIIFFTWVVWIWIMVVILTDVFRRRDISGWGKAAWTVFVVIIPWIGVLVYLIANHQGMADRRVKEVQASQAQLDEYVRKTAGTGGAASEIEKAKELLDKGTITQAQADKLSQGLSSHLDHFIDRPGGHGHNGAPKN